jgi:hypothetical protein
MDCRTLLSLLTAGFTEIFLRGRLKYAGGYIAIIRVPKKGYIRTPVKSSVTPENQSQKRLCPTQDHSLSEVLGQKPERRCL